MIDIEFIEFFIKKKYSQSIDNYFDVSRPVLSVYEDSNFYLNRKKETFEKVINTIKDKIKYRKNKKS